MKPQMICRLCQRPGKLRNSHIIPEFLYKLLYDSKHRFRILSSDPACLNKLEQKGLRERLLCESCEAKLSKYEDHARRVLLGGQQIAIQKAEGKILVSGIDYRKFKLFQLSLLWRAGVATREMFKAVKLGRHEEILRQMILAEDTGEPHQYGCLIVALLFKGKLLTDVMHNVDKVRTEGHYCYRFFLPGLIWVFFVSRHKPSTRIVENFLTRSGTLNILIAPREFVEGFLNRLAEDLSSAGRL